MLPFVSRSRPCLAGAIVISALAGAGCHHTEPRPQPLSQHLAASPAPVVGGQTPTPSLSKTPVKDAIEALLSQNEHGGPIPHGTRLLHASVESGVATLDFSHEFAALANSGDSNESEAQRQLRAALAGVDGVDKMRVTVEGKTFDSQATDWNTPFVIRGADGEADVRKGGGLER